MLTEMVCEISAMQEFPAGMAADCHGVVSSFHCKGLGNFQGGEWPQLRNMPAEENILCFGVGAVVAPIYACLGHHIAMADG